MKCSLVLSSLLVLGAASLTESRPSPLESLDLGGACGHVSKALGRAKKDVIVVDVDDDHRGKTKDQNQNQGKGKGKGKGKKKGGESTRREAGFPS
ncbi:hypothetical protein JCM21900_000484 [Sporobolomyces salmonicolor]